MYSLEPSFLESLSFSPEVVSTLRRLGEYRGKQGLYLQQKPQTLKSLQQIAMIESSESSNRLEGATAPRRRIEQIVLQSVQPHNRSEQEIAGYRDALGLLHGSAANMEFSTHLVSQCHSILYRYLPQPSGHWKSTDNYIVEQNPDGSIREIQFTPVSAVQTPQAMETWVSNYHRAIDQGGHDPLIVIPLAILDFLCIHPFSDGNGRMARLMTLFLLYRFDYQVGSYISLERIFEESQAAYYKSLERSSQDWHQGRHDIWPWASYFWSVLLRAYEEFESRVGRVPRGKGAKTVRIREVVSSKIHPFAISDIESDCPGISRDMIRLVLRQLRDEGSIRLQGKGRGAKWLNASVADR